MTCRSPFQWLLRFLGLAHFSQCTGLHYSVHSPWLSATETKSPPWKKNNSQAFTMNDITNVQNIPIYIYSPSRRFNPEYLTQTHNHRASTDSVLTSDCYWKIKQNWNTAWKLKTSSLGSSSLWTLQVGCFLWGWFNIYRKNLHYFSFLTASLSAQRNSCLLLQVLTFAKQPT